MIRIIGIDPGLTKTGWGIIDIKNNQLFFVASGTIYSSPKQKMAERLCYFYEELSKVINCYKPEIASIEETFVNINPVSSLKLGHIRGVIILTVAKNNLHTFEYSSTAVKKTIVGNGRADKNQIQAMIKILLPKADFHSEDEADALAIAICHFHHQTTY